MITKFKIYENINNFDDEKYASNYNEIDLKYQNFYSNCAKSLIDFSLINKEDLILELGSGTGFSTKELIKKVGNNVIATEYGEAMFNILKTKIKNAFKMDARDINKFIRQKNLENKIDVVFSNFTYFYFYNFEDKLYKDICENVLKKGGKYVFNVTNFLTKFRFNEINYNTFYDKIRIKFNEYLKNKGFEAGIGEDKIIVEDIYNIEKKLYTAGFKHVIMEPYIININPVTALEFMINNFYSFGFNIAWSSTLNELPLNKRIFLLKEGLEYIKKDLNTDEKPTIINIIAYK